MRGREELPLPLQARLLVDRGQWSVVLEFGRDDDAANEFHQQMIEAIRAAGEDPPPQLFIETSATVQR